MSIGDAHQTVLCAPRFELGGGWRCSGDRDCEGTMALAPLGDAGRILCAFKFQMNTGFIRGILRVKSTLFTSTVSLLDHSCTVLKSSIHL
jgi:hypothetical protein